MLTYLKAGLTAVAGAVASMGAPYVIGTGTGEVGETIGNTFTDLGVSFLTNFVVILQLAIPLIVIFAVVQMVRKYVGK